MKLLLTFVLIGLLLGCRNSDEPFYSVVKSKDPSTLSLEAGYNVYIKRTFLNEGEIETGVITLLDGDIVKYWFQSHHLRKDSGISLFRLSNGDEKIMHGWFCCEVQLPEENFKDRKSFFDYVVKHDGIKP